MRIALNGRFYAAPLTGVQRFAREVAGRLAERADVVLLLPRGADLPPGSTFGHVVRGHLRGHAWEQTELSLRARAAACDVCLSMAGTLPAAGGPHVAVLHDVLPLTHPEWFSRRFSAWYRIAAGRNARGASRLVTVSAWSADRIAEVLSFPRDRIVVAPQGVAPFDAPATPAEVARVRGTHQLPDRFVLALGHGDPRKNLPFLAEVMGEWRRRDAGTPGLVVVGRGETRVHGSAPTGPDGEGVHVLGRVDEETLRALYTAARVLAFPSLAEGYGRPPLEALACGTPAVAAPYAAAREVLGEAVPLVPLDVDAWISQLHRLAQAGPERDAWVERGRTRARQGSWDAAATRVLEACAAAVAQPVHV